MKAASSYRNLADSASQQQESEWAVFPAKAPWIPTTPASRIATKKEDNTEGAVGSNAAGQPVMQPSSLEATDVMLSPEEEKLLEHLKALQSANLDLSESMQRKLEVLLAKQQNSSTIKPLNHGHLNRLRKLKTQVTSAGKRIAELDREWSGFVEKTMSKVREHATMYQTCRADMLETYNKKLAELESLKKELSTASLQMLASEQVEPAQMVPQNVEAQVHAMQEVIDVESVVGHVDLTDDMEEEEEPMGAERAGQSFKASPKVSKAFRGATSPTKVAQQHLKVKFQDTKENKAKE